MVFNHRDLGSMIPMKTLGFIGYSSTNLPNTLNISSIPFFYILFILVETLLVLRVSLVV